MLCGSGGRRATPWEERRLPACSGTVANANQLGRGGRFAGQPRSPTLWALSDVAGWAGETRCRKIKELRTEAGRVRLNDFREKAGLAEDCSDRPATRTPGTSTEAVRS